MIQRTVIVSDLQVPYHDVQAVKNLGSFIRAWKPHKVVTIGDEIDLPQISRWTEGTAGWYEQTLAQDRDLAVQTLYDLQVTDVIRSNHTDRLYNVIMKKIPAFLALPELKFERFMQFEDLGITYHKKPMNIAPNWIAIHGDEQGINPNAGLTALGAARRHGKSVICGHTHRAGRSAFTESSGGSLGRVLHGVEVGNLMDFKQAGYTKGTANWQQCFATMETDGKRVNVQLIYIEKDGTFLVSGKRYGKPR